DGIIKFEVVASENAAQYAYVVLPGSDNKAPEALNILTGEVSGAEAGESFSSSGNLGASLAANVILDCSTFMTVATEYEVFAVAITETGLVGEITSALIVMNDTIAPQLAGGAYDNNMIQLTFSEEIIVGSGKASVVYFKQISSELLDEVEIPSANITVNGNVATIVCPKPADGSVYYLLQLQKGTFEDLSGNQFQSIRTGFNNQGQINGLAWMSDPVTFAIGDDCFSTAATDWSAEGAAITFTMPFNVYESGLRDGIKVAYKDDWGSKEVITPYALGEDRRTVTVTLPEKPLGTFDLIIAEGLFYDDWGNWNAARDPEEYIYENYWMTLKDGNYMIDYSADDETVEQFPATFELLTRDIVVWNADWFNIFGGYALPTNLLGVVDYKTKTIIFDGSWIYENDIYDYLCFGLDTYYWDQAKTQIMVFWGSGESGQEPIIMNFDDEGYITSTTGFDYSIYDDATKKYLGVAAYTSDGAHVTYVPEEESEQKTFNAYSDAFETATLARRDFLKVR
ncbi:MAG: hypothetical protein IJE85_08465, partial [Bacteroidales bacterium]|nr:hypothetical protein [Bacteroidales bacterium]